MTSERPRGRLRLYLGAAPGVGKTFAMLNEGHRRAARGTDVVAGLVVTHGRPPVIELMRGLPTVPEHVDEESGRRVEQIDVEGLIERAPEVALVDDLAHANAAGSRHPKRWQDVQELLDAGIDVISTLNIQHIESLSDVAETITETPTVEVVPDEFVRAAAQIELVDMTPEALRRRLAHGNIYEPEVIDATLSQYFRPGNLAALRELALRWVADRVDEDLEQYRHDHYIESTWATRELVVVALTGGPESGILLRRAARIASRKGGARLHAVYVTAEDKPVPALHVLAELRALTDQLAGTLHTVVSDVAPGAVVQIARSLNATQIVVGSSRRPRWRRVLEAGVSERIIARSGDIDVLVVTHPFAAPSLLPDRRSALGVRRLLAGWLLAATGTILLTLALLPTRDQPTVALEALSYLALTVACALVGGLWPALTVAVVANLLLNWFFTPPLNTLTIGAPVNVAALILFLVVAVAVASVVDKAARRSVQANLASREADILVTLNRRLLRSDQDAKALLELLITVFRIDSASLLRDSGSGWEAIAEAGPGAPLLPQTADTTAEVSSTLTLALRGDPLKPHEHRVLSAFAAHVAAVLERADLSARADEAQLLEEGNRVRTALLAAVSHDLRTPLAGVKAAVSSLRSPDVHWGPEDEAEFLAAIEESTDRLHSIVTNLLDLSRLQVDVVRPTIREIGMDDVASRALAQLPQGGEVELRVPRELPPVLADPGLLERVIANLVENALRYSPAASPVTVTISTVGERVQLHVVDRGAGVSETDKDQLFRAFQRLDDTKGPDGIGLGLAVAKGLTEALAGTLRAEDTPGGGLTMIVDLPAAHLPDAQSLDGTGEQ